MFYEQLQVVTDMKEGSLSFRGFAAFDFGKLSMSVQAGCAKYSNPRKRLADLSGYKSWEMAFLDESGSLTHPRDLVEHLPEDTRSFLERAWPANDVVAGYVSTPVVEALFQSLCKNLGTPRNAPSMPRQEGALRYRLEGVGVGGEEKPKVPIRINTAVLRGIS